MPPKPEPLDIPTFATTQLTLLARELAAETAETSLLASTFSAAGLARAGLAILNLAPTSQRTGLGGKTVVELGLDSAVAGKGREGADIPEHGIRVGDIVGVREQVSGAAKKREREGAAKKGVEGVVLRVGRERVEVALDGEEVEVPGGRLWMWVCRGAVEVLGGHDG
ncbi:hypothetical protein AOQ84DRAFT_443676 [Glonium stellatum]|uniref:Helicase SMUBP-2/HCS1 1B domain-containing protein n=1 Tax=Glonium stellatum TaxID=574774 RepID=A0A8E2JLY7_9PEZI|nr:hypothetical protein AOQ84DRAFT_443676 [Glonium stellatum]